MVRTAALAPPRAIRRWHAANNEIQNGGHLVLLDLCGWKRPYSEDHVILFVGGTDTKGRFPALRRMGSTHIAAPRTQQWLKRFCSSCMHPGAYFIRFLYDTLSVGYDNRLVR